MEFPLSLKAEIEKQAAEISKKELLEISETISNRYRMESGKGKRLVTTKKEALVYSIVRMPATFGAVTAALEAILSTTDFNPITLLDVGAGTGAASWGVSLLTGVKKIVCLEREEAMLTLGKEFMQQGFIPLKEAEWNFFDLTVDNLEKKADFVVASYVLNECSKENRLSCLQKLWNATTGMLLLVEPGTPEGFRQLKEAREYLLQKNAHLVAPCPHETACKLAEGDWCHFTCRVPRSKLHKLLKGADVPYEDEKFSYMAFTRFSREHSWSRVLRHPYMEKGKVTLEVCTKTEIKKLIVKKSDGIIYKKARKIKNGDQIGSEG